MPQNDDKTGGVPHFNLTIELVKKKGGPQVEIQGEMEWNDGDFTVTHGAADRPKINVYSVQVKDPAKPEDGDNIVWALVERDESKDVWDGDTFDLSNSADFPAFNSETGAAIGYVLEVPEEYTTPGGINYINGNVTDYTISYTRAVDIDTLVTLQGATTALVGQITAQLLRDGEPYGDPWMIDSVTCTKSIEKLPISDVPGYHYFYSLQVDANESLISIQGTDTRQDNGDWQLDRTILRAVSSATA